MAPPPRTTSRPAAPGKLAPAAKNLTGAAPVVTSNIPAATTDTAVSALVQGLAPLGSVTFGHKIKIGLPGYSSSEVFVSVSIPSSEDDASETIDRAAALVAEKINAYAKQYIDSARELIPSDGGTTIDTGLGGGADEGSVEADPSLEPQDDDSPVSPEEIGNFSREQLVEFLDSYSAAEGWEDLAQIKHSDTKTYPKTKAGLAKLKADTLEIYVGLLGDGTTDEGAEGEEGGAEGDDSAVLDDGAGEVLDKEALEAYSLADLKALWKSWVEDYQLPLGEFPKGLPPASKAAAIKALLAAQGI